MKIKNCKYCGTTILNDFIYPSGKVMKSVCVKCNSKNRSNAKLGKKNGMYGMTGDKCPTWNPNTLHTGECKHCGTTTPEDFIQPCGRQLKLSCHKCYSEILSKQKKLNNPMKKIENRIKNSMSQGTIDYYKKNHPLFCKIEEIRENPVNKLGETNIQVRCKQCKKWFTPINNQLTGRIRSLEHPDGHDGEYLYCSDECKNKCPLYALNPGVFLNEYKNILYTPSEYQTFRQEVLSRQVKELGHNECEVCGNRTNLHIHHEKPQKTNPLMILDPDNGIVLCEKCHYSKGHKDKCSTGNLSKIICI